MRPIYRVVAGSIAMLALMNGGCRTQGTTGEVIKGVLGGAIEAFVIDALKDREFTGEDNWGHQVETLFGRKNDGLWLRYSAKPEDPQHKTDFKVVKIERRAIDKFYIESRLSTDVRGTARAQFWKLDLLLGDVDAEARTTLIIDAGLDAKLAGDLLKAEFDLEPSVQKTEVDIKDFVLDKIGPVGGVVAAEIGDLLTTLGRKTLEKAKDDVAKQLQEALRRAAANADLRVKLRDFLR